MKKFKSFLVLALALMLALSVFTGCGKGGKRGGTDVDVSETKYGTEYPLETGDAKLTVWHPLNTVVAGLGYSTYADTPIAQELEKKTGIKIEWIEPDSASSGDKFNLMLAGGEDLPDLIRYSWSYYPGGPQSAIDEGIIIPLNDMMDAGWAPAFTALMEQYPEIAKEGKTDSGLYYGAGTIAPERSLNTTAGPIIRIDWLEELGLEMPETIDEWETVLKAFKAKPGCKIPLAFTSMQGIGCGAFIGAYQIGYDFYQVDGKVMYGPAQPAYKEFLTTMHRWYKEGLLDKNFSTTDAATVNAGIINDEVGASWNALGGGIGVYTNANPDAHYGGAPYPTHKKGETPWFGQASARFGISMAITTGCKDPELAMKWLDYGYTEEGHMLYNFGIEGTSYEWVEKDGEQYPQYTELVTNNPDGLSMSQVFATYSQAGQGGNYRQDVRYLEQYAGLPQQQDAWAKWVNTATFDHWIPPVNIADEDAADYAVMSADIASYRDEMYVKFVMGTESLDNFDKYVAQLNKLGLQEVTAMTQAAYDAFQAR